MRLFWRRGFDGVSVADLTAEMGISTPSLYAAFGDKRRLFWEVVARYVEGPGAFFEQAMANEMTVRRGVDRALHAAATQYTATSQPPGCLVISAGVNCALGSVDVERELRLRRRANQRALARRIAADVKSGLLPVETDSRRLAVLVGAILQGMSQQARDGATEADLHAVADAAMLAWPTEMRAG
jgi:AcrR family transcriptional regulator